MAARALQGVALLALRVLAAVLALAWRACVAGVAQLESATSPAKLAPLALLRRSVLLLALGAASLAGLWLGARTKTQLDPSPWHPRAGHADVPPAGSSSAYLTAPFAPTTLADGRRLHHLTVATHGEEGLARLVRSASWHGNSIKVLGVGDPRLQKWGVGFGVKVECMLAYARTVAPEDLLLFTDAFDVVMWGSHEDVAAGYDRALARAAAVADPLAAAGAKPRPPPRLLVSAELLPTTWNGIAYGDLYPRSVTAGQHFPYLNSGTFLAPAGELLAWLGSAAMDMNDNDQAFFNALFVASLANASAALPRVALDHANDVFLTLTAAPPARETAATHLSYDPVARRWKHLATPGFPLVFHSPGWSRWKQVDEAWGLAQGRNCCGHWASSFQWPTLAALALDATISALLAGLALGMALPLLALALSRKPVQRALAAGRARAAGVPLVGPLVACCCGSPGGGGRHYGEGLPTTYSAVPSSAPDDAS